MQVMNSRNDQLTVIIYGKLHFILQKIANNKVSTKKKANAISCISLS